MGLPLRRRSREGFGAECRTESDIIYKGFSFKHLSGVTVAPSEGSENSVRIVIYQSVGEAIALACDFLKSFLDKEPIGEFYFNSAKQNFIMDINIPQDWRDNDVFSRDVFRGRFDMENNVFEWYDKENKPVSPGYNSCLLYLTVLMAAVVMKVEIRNKIIELVNDYTEYNFVGLYKDFYHWYICDSELCPHSSDKFIKEINWGDYQRFSAVFGNYFRPREEKTKAMKTTEFADTEFSDEYISLIPALGDEFVLDEKLKNLCTAITCGSIKTVLFHGPAGTGKTISCKLICKTIRLPILETVNCTENLDEFILGKFIPENDRIVFKESYVTKAIREGGAVVFEEINFAKPQYLAFLNSLLDDNGFVRLDNGEFVRRHKNFRFFATMNVGYFGTKQLNQALYNRFNAIVEIAQLSETAISRMLLTRVPECSDKINKVLVIHDKIKKKIENEELDIVISPRNLENWVRLAKYEGYVAAAEKTIIPIAKCDRILEATFRDIIKIYKW